MSIAVWLTLAGVSSGCVALAVRAHRWRRLAEAESERADAAEGASREVLALCEGAPDLLTVLSADGTVIYGNRALAFVSGVPDHLLRGLSFVELFEAASQDTVRDAIARALGGNEVADVDCRLGSGERVLDVSLSAAVVATGDTQRVCVVMRNVARRRRSQSKVQQAQRLEAIGQLAGGIAHDFNNNLSAIIGFSELLLMQVEDPELISDLTVIRDAGRQSAELTRQILAFSRKQLLRPTAVELGGLVRGLERLLHRLLGDHIDIMFSERDGATWAMVDPAQFEQVVVNLAINARDAMPGGGRLTLETGCVEIADDSHLDVPPGRYSFVAVRDTGTGIDAETRERIFEPFFTTKPEGQGTGLGLAMVHGFVSQSGGTIDLLSAPGRGTTFKIFLPWAEEQRYSVTRQDLPAVLRGGSETILVVEDQELVRRTVVRTLESHGYEVLASSNGAEALSMLLKHDGVVDLVVSDVMMPGMTGPELMRKVRRIRQATRFIYVTGNPGDELSDELDRGIDVIRKPIEAAVLISRVRAALDAPGRHGARITPW